MIIFSVEVAITVKLHVIREELISITKKITNYNEKDLIIKINDAT